MLEDSHIVSFNLLFNLQDVETLWELFNLRTTNSINKTSLTNTVTADETVLFATDKLQSRAFKQRFTANNESNTENIDILDETLTSLMSDLWWGNFPLVLHELMHFFVKSIVCFGFLFLDNFSEFTLVELGVVVGFAALHTNEGIKEIFIANRVSLVLEITHRDGLSKLLSNDSVSLLDFDQLLFEQDLRE